jgi:hypothetical protein
VLKEDAGPAFSSCGSPALAQRQGPEDAATVEEVIAMYRIARRAPTSA